MNILTHISIKNKLLLNVIVPILTVVIISAIVIIGHIDKKNEYENFNAIVQLDSKISLLVHETQKERGVTAGYLGSKGEKFSDKLPTQREHTDRSIKELQEYIKNSNVEKNFLIKLIAP